MDAWRPSATTKRPRRAVAGRGAARTRRPSPRPESAAAHTGQARAREEVREGSTGGKAVRGTLEPARQGRRRRWPARSAAPRNSTRHTAGTGSRSALIALGVIVAAGVWWQAAGPVGRWVEIGVRTVIGAGAVALPLVLLVVGDRADALRPAAGDPAAAGRSARCWSFSLLGLLHLFSGAAGRQRRPDVRAAACSASSPAGCSPRASPPGSRCRCWCSRWVTACWCSPARRSARSRSGCANWARPRTATARGRARAAARGAAAAADRGQSCASRRAAGRPRRPRRRAAVEPEPPLDDAAAEPPPAAGQGDPRAQAEEAKPAQEPPPLTAAAGRRRRLPAAAAEPAGRGRRRRRPAARPTTP